jgi:amino acid permease
VTFLPNHPIPNNNAGYTFLYGCNMTPKDIHVYVCEGSLCIKLKMSQHRTKLYMYKAYETVFHWIAKASYFQIQLSQAIIIIALFLISLSEFCIKRIIVRSLFTCAILFVAESIPKFGNLLSLVGGTTTALLSFFFPVYFYNKLCDSMNRYGNHY